MTTEAQIRAELGRPVRVLKDYWPPQRRVYGWTLTYRCGRKCLTQYSINARTRRLSDWWTQSQRFVTERGTRVGMTGGEASRREGKPLVPGCGFPRYVHLRFDERHIFVLAIVKGRVDSIGYLGPHTVYYDGLC